MNESERNNKKMIILVYSINSNIKNINTNIIESNDIICPTCKEICKYEIKEHRIKLYECKYGHMKDNIKFDEFNNTQNIDISKIKCDKCKNKSKSNTFKNEFYLCIGCKMNLCPLCKSVHEKTHSIINYDNKFYICNKHNETFVKYCEECKIDLCFSCINEHIGHKIISYEDILIDTKILRNSLNSLKKRISKFKDNLEEIIKKFKKLIENMELYYNINEKIIKKYEMNKNRNYNLLISLKNIKESIDEEAKYIINEYIFGNDLNAMLYLYNEFNDENVEIEFKYEFDSNKIFEKNKNGKNKKSLRIFGNQFINDNKYKCKIIYNKKEYELNEYFEDIDEEYNFKNPIKFKLKGVNNISDMSWMFDDCNSIASINLSKWNTSNVFDMRGMFNNCNSLLSLPDISKWNTSNVHCMSDMFEKCNSLLSLPNISKWNTSNVDSMSDMFKKCNSLLSLPDISKWNTSNVTSMSDMFENCNSLLSLPDISKWNTSNVTDMSGMFIGCKSLSSFPNISKWNTSNVTDMSGMFGRCESLFSLPDISKWNTSNVIDMSDMFIGCNKSLNIPSKFKK